MKYVFAGNRDIAVRVLRFTIGKGYYPEALMITDRESEISKQLIELANLTEDKIFVGAPGKNNYTNELKKINVDYFFGIHYPFIISEEILNIPKIGFLNLHPAFLPYNRGWNTISWAILDNTPIGATLHFMSKELDMGDIINRKEIEIAIDDTAHTLYRKVKKLEFDIFKESFNSLLKNDFNLIGQKKSEGTSHVKKDLLDDELCKLDLRQSYNLEELINKLRALTTNKVSEAAYFLKNGEKYRVQIKIVKD